MEVFYTTQSLNAYSVTLCPITTKCLNKNEIFDITISNKIKWISENTITALQQYYCWVFILETYSMHQYSAI